MIQEMLYVVNKQRENNSSYRERLNKKERVSLVKKEIKFVIKNLGHVLNDETNELMVGIGFELSNRFGIDYIPNRIEKFILRKSAEKLTNSFLGVSIY